MPNTETGGGAHITGNASAGNDFVGRDASTSRDAVGRDVVGHDVNHGNSVHIAMERLSEASESGTAHIRRLAVQIDRLSDDVTALTRALIGDARYGSTGLVQQVREMDDLGKSRERWRVTSTWVLVALLLSQIVQGWLLWQVYALYWAIYQAVGG